MKNTWIKYSLIGVGGVSLLTLGLMFWFKSTPSKVVNIRILQTRSASFTADLEKILARLPMAHQGIQIEVLYRDAASRPFPDFDGLITEGGTLRMLQESEEVSTDAIPLFEEGYQVLYYNKKMTQAVPKTWDELIGQTVVQASQSLDRFGLAMSSEAFAVFPFVARGFLDEQGKNRQALQTVFLKEGVEALKTLRYTFSLTPRDCSAECTAQIFLQGKAPFALAGEWRWREFSQKLGTDLGMAPLPQMESGPSLGMRSTVFLAASRSADATRQQAMKELQASLRSAQGSDLIFSQLGKVPSSYLVSGTADAQAQQLTAVIQQSTIPVDEAVYQHIIDALRSPIHDYYQGLLASSETIDLLVKVAL